MNARAVAGLLLLSGCATTSVRFSAPSWSQAPAIRAAIMCAVSAEYGEAVASIVSSYPVAVASDLPFPSMIYAGSIVLRQGDEALMEAGWRHESLHVALHQVTKERYGEADWFDSGRCKTDPRFWFEERSFRVAYAECRRRWEAPP